MKKIVITTDRAEGVNDLLVSLNRLFPDCEILIMPTQSNGLDNGEGDTDLAASDNCA